MDWVRNKKLNNNFLTRYIFRIPSIQGAWNQHQCTGREGPLISKSHSRVIKVISDVTRAFSATPGLGRRNCKIITAQSCCAPRARLLQSTVGTTESISCRRVLCWIIIDFRVSRCINKRQTVLVRNDVTRAFNMTPWLYSETVKLLQRKAAVLANTTTLEHCWEPPNAPHVDGCGADHYCVVRVPGKTSSRVHESNGCHCTTTVAPKMSWTFRKAQFLLYYPGGSRPFHKPF